MDFLVRILPRFYQEIQDYPRFLSRVARVFTLGFFISSVAEFYEMIRTIPSEIFEQFSIAKHFVERKKMMFRDQTIIMQFHILELDRFHSTSVFVYFYIDVKYDQPHNASSITSADVANNMNHQETQSEGQTNQHEFDHTKYDNQCMASFNLPWVIPCLFSVSKIMFVNLKGPEFAF